MNRIQLAQERVEGGLCEHNNEPSGTGVRTDLLPTYSIRLRFKYFLEHTLVFKNLYFMFFP